MKKMLIALLLALTLLVSAVPSFAEEAPKELKFVYIDGWSSVDDGDTTSAITQKIAEETGVLISPVTAGGDRGTILLSSGEVGDCLMVYNATMLKTCVENGMMLDLSTLVSEEKTPAILSNPDRIQMAQVLSETDDGSYYFLPVQCGSEGAPMTPYHSLFNVRWDLYKQMGYPEVTDTDSMLALLSEMQKLNPTTEDGKTVYGYSLELGNFRQAYWPWHYTFGYYTSNDFISTNINTGEMVYEPLDENSPMWSFLEYLNKAYKAGLFDPDSFTQTGDDMKAKIAAGQVLSPIWASDGVQYEAANPNTAEEFRGFQTLPVEGTTYWCNSYYNGGWDACFVGIPANSSDPEAALRVLEYLSTDDGARLVDSGIQGVHWDYDENGVPTLTDEIIEAYNNWSDVFVDSCIQNAIFGTLTAMGNGELHSDGYPVNLFMTEQVYTRELSACDKDYCDYYGVSYPMKLFLNKMEEGTIHDHINDIFDMRVVTGMGSAPEDIARIDETIVNKAKDMLPTIIMAEDFEATKAECLKTLWSYNAQEARDWWQARHDSLTELFTGRTK